MQQASEFDLIYAEEIRPAVFGDIAHDTQRGGALTACVVFGPPGAGKKNVALRAGRLLQSHGLKTVAIDHAVLLDAHPERDSLSQHGVDLTLCRWRDAAVDEAARRCLGVVVSAPLASPNEAVALLDRLETRGYKTIAFAVCTPDAQRDGAMHPNRSDRDHASYVELGKIASVVKNHASVVKLSLVSKQCESFFAGDNISHSVEQARDAIRYGNRVSELVKRRDPIHSSGRRRQF